MFTGSRLKDIDLIKHRSFISHGGSDDALSRAFDRDTKTPLVIEPPLADRPTAEQNNEPLWFLIELNSNMFQMVASVEMHLRTGEHTFTTVLIIETVYSTHP